MLFLLHFFSNSYFCHEVTLKDFTSKEIKEKNSTDSSALASNKVSMLNMNDTYFFFLLLVCNWVVEK